MATDLGLLPSATLQPYGQNILKYGIGQLGTPIDVGALTPQVAGQSAFQQAAAQSVADMSGLGAVQRDATGQVTGFTGGTGVASYQPYIDQIGTQQLLDPSGYQQFMSPYQREVIDTTMADFDRQAAIQQKGIADQAFTMLVLLVVQDKVLSLQNTEHNQIETEQHYLLVYMVQGLHKHKINKQQFR